MVLRETICGAALAALFFLPTGAAAEECRPTATNIEGPYYLAGAPFRADVAPAGGVGDRLVLEGTVYAADCKTPLENAVVEIWQAGPEGKYDFSGRFLWRGRARTDARGHYLFRTVLPGRYGSGGAFRPAHLHLKISHEKGRTLITQAYVAGDPWIAKDPFAEPSLVVSLERLKEKGAPRYRGVFDIVLDRP